MIDIKLVRESPQIIRNDLEKRNRPDKLRELEELISLDKKWKDALSNAEELKRERNILSKEINELKKAGKDATEKLNLVKNIPAKIKVLDEDVEEYKKRINEILMGMPNILHESVPIGADDKDNKVERVFGKKPYFNFEPKSHVDIIESYGLVDLERAAKISGARWYFLTGDLAMLDFALQKYALDFMHKKGYSVVYPPIMMGKKAYEGVTDLKDFEDAIYKIEGEDLYMIATSEHPLTARFSDEVIEDKNLAMKFAGVSPCFRKEAGAHGKDTKGIFRVHQFNKIEQIIFSKPEDSWRYHEELIQNAIEIFESLGFHFRIVNVCTGDIGTVAAKKYDLEAWMPVQNAYREMVSCSNCTDYQARRLNIKYNTGDGNKYIHTLNSTALATTRVIVAIIENFQDKDGNIHIPKVLLPYMNGLEMITPKR
jgi:seryl-tRNA synthetase